MKKLVWAIVVLTVIATGCRRNEKPAEEETDLVVQSNMTPEQKDFAGAFKGFITAFKALDMENLKAGDFTKLNEFIHPKEGIYTIFPGQGAYSDFMQYVSMEDLVADETIREAIGYFKQAMEGAQGESGDIIYEDLSEIDPCDIKEVGYYGDYGKTNILSETYNAMQENLGEDPIASEAQKMKHCEDNVKIKVYVGIGEEAEVFYFTNDGGKWYISIMDFSECGE